MNYDTWRRHHDEDLPHTKYCASVALLQMRLGRYFLREQPSGPWTDEVDPWPRVVPDNSAFVQSMGQCMAGAVDKNGIPVKKSTDWTATSEALLAPFGNMFAMGVMSTVTQQERIWKS